MSFDRQHVLLTWGGDLSGGEKWVCSLRTAPFPIVPGAVFINDDDLASLSPSYVAAVKAFHASQTLKLSSLAKLTFVKLAAIGTDGKYIPGAVSVKETVFAPIGGAGGMPGSYDSTSPQVNQVALCITTTTDMPRGYGHQGRFYLPVPQMFPAADGLISAADADGVKAAVKTFIEAIADVPGIDTDVSPTPCVMSRHGTGSTHKITGAKVGRVLDTQRRRRRSLPENYRIVAVDTGAF